jgi:MFS family permease
MSRPRLNRQTQIFSSDPIEEKSLRHSIKDGAYFAAMNGGAESYFSALAKFLQASTLTIGLLASLPPLLASFMQLFSAWLGRKIGRGKQIMVFGATLGAFVVMRAVSGLIYDIVGRTRRARTNDQD